MADFRKLAIALIAADGSIDATEIKVLKKALYADGRISHDEVLFLTEVRAAVLKKVKGAPIDAFDKFYLAAFHDSILGNGIISAEEADMAKKYIIGDKTLVGHAKKFLDGLKKKATSVAPEFDALYSLLAKKK